MALLLALTPVSDVSALKAFSVCRGSDKGQFWRQVLRSEGPVPGLHLLPLWEGLLHPSAAQAAAGIKAGHCSGETCSISRM